LSETLVIPALHELYDADADVARVRRAIDGDRDSPKL
jgi:hypothetical protein